MAFLRKKKPDVEATREQKLEIYGISVVSGDQLKERLDKMEELAKEIHSPLTGEQPIDKMKNLREKIQKVDTLVRRTSIAWLRSGTEKDYRRAVNGYENLLRYVTRDWTVVYNDMSSKPSVEQLKMEIEFELWPASIYLKEALFLTSMSFFDKDISQTLDRTMVVQAQPMPFMPFGASAGTTPTSGGRTSEETLPPSGPYPPTLDNSTPKRDKKDERTT